MTRFAVTIAIILTIILHSASILAGEAETANDSPVRKIRRSMGKLRESMKSAPDTPIMSKTSSDDLRAMIAQLDGMSASTAVSEVKALTLRKDESKKTEPTTQPSSTKIEKKPEVDKSVPQKVLDELKKTDPASGTGPLTVANLAFDRGELPVARVFYELVAKCDVDDETKAWALYQMGNCDRKSHPGRSAEAYEKAVDKYPKTLWGRLAVTENDVLAWEMGNDPVGLLKKIENDPVMKVAKKKKSESTAEAE